VSVPTSQIRRRLTPKTTCREQTAPRGVFRFTQATDIRRSRLTWRWAKGEATTAESYGIRANGAGRFRARPGP
jgi:hypothetical protein